MLFLFIFAVLSAVLTIMAAPAADLALPKEAPSKGSVSLPINKRVAHFHKPNSTIVDFEMFQGHLMHIRAKYSRNMANFRTNTRTEHPFHKASNTTLEGRATGKVGLTDVNDYVWIGTIAFGQPAQSILVDFDTGSADTLVNAGAYRPAASSTSVRTSRTFHTSYGDGTSATGTVYRDTVHIGGLSAPSAAIGLAGQSFLNPTTEGGDQGISGLSFQSISTFGLPGFFDSLRSAGVLSSPVFSFRLAETGSMLTLGGYDPAEISGGITWIPVDPSKGFWVVPGQFNGFGHVTSIMDTGTTAIIMPFMDALAVFKSLGMSALLYGGALYGTFNCSRPPPLTFIYGGKSVTLTGTSQTLGTDKDGACISVIVGQDGHLGGAWIVGDAFLRNVISIFDKGNNRFGIANLAR
ncbi:hypothetical protein CF319_g939 [Tilletia indica]|nr:hypothetical protein CF319_g939 [Tilletia indica]